MVNIKCLVDIKGRYDQEKRCEVPFRQSHTRLSDTKHHSNYVKLALELLIEDLSDPTALEFDSSIALLSCCGIPIHYQHGGRH